MIREKERATKRKRKAKEKASTVPINKREGQMR